MSLDSYTEHWQDAVSNALNEYCPLKTVNAKKSYTPSPWVDDELRQTLFKRKRAHRAMIKRPDRSDLLQQFRTLRRQCKLLTRKKRSTYFQQQLIYHRNHPREQWSVMNNLLGRIKINQEPAAEVADITKTFTDVVNDTSLSGSTLRTPNGPVSEYSLTQFTPVTVPQVQLHIQRMNSRKATGPDNIPAQAYKLIKDEIAPSLAKLFTKSLTSGDFPSTYKLANVRPIYKRGDKSVPSNYRPISLLSHMSKLLEHIVHDQLMYYIYNAPPPLLPLPAEQFAYRRGHSCEDLLTPVINDWMLSLDNGDYVVAAFLDMSKAFDTVSHEVLLSELLEIGVGGTALQWFCSYLTHRKQRVVTKTQQGLTYSSNRGVPQGSVLGPSLFNLSVRKLPSVPQHCKARQYADDVSLYKAGKNVKQLCKELTEDIVKVKEFLAARGLLLNPSKTQFVVFRSKCKPLDPSVALQLGEVTINPSAHIRYLGIILDEHLSFGEHVRQLERKVGSKLAMFRKVRDHMTVTAKRAFYICSIQTVLEYGSNSFAHCLSVTLHDRLVRLSNRALRIVFSMPRFSDVSLINARHHILPLSVRYQFKLYILVFRVLNQVTTTLLTDCFCLRSTSTRTNSCTRSQVSSSVTLPKAKTRFGLFSVSFIGSDRWNALPAAVRLCSSLHLFRNSVLSFLGYPVRRP